MTLELHFHPLASFCHKALIALYENATPFEPVIVDLADERSRAAFAAIWPLARMPVLRDRARDRTAAESTIVVEYLESFYPGPTRLLPADPDMAWQVRLWDRFFDHYVQEPMQKIVLDALRPAGHRDSYGVAQAKALLAQALDMAEQRLAGRVWMVGPGFSLADCAAAPALFYADTVAPFGETHPELAGYLARLTARPAFARVLAEAEPYFRFFPLDPKPRIRRPGDGSGR
jgi:glutathione S-transferase